jgi:predicted Fe-Mo cluster-binding NifX family protein
MVTQHFGRATVFHIFDVEPGDGWTLLESRPNGPSCTDDEATHDSLLAKASDLVSDCDGIVAARIGPGAVRALYEHNVETYQMHALIEEALQALSEELARVQTKTEAEEVTL